jgi:hypothetical protein
MKQFFYVPLNREPFFPSVDGQIVITDETLPVSIRPSTFKYAIGDTPFGAFFKGAADYVGKNVGNKGGSTGGVQAVEKDDDDIPPPTFLQKYGLYLIGGAVLVVVVAAGITTYKAFKK